MTSSSSFNNVRSNKQKFLASLDDLTTLNQASKERTSLLKTMISAQKVLVDDIKSVNICGRESDTSDSEGDGKGESIPLATTTTRTVSLDKPETD